MSASWFQAPLFQSLDAAQREHLEQIAVTKRLDVGQILFQEGEACSGFFVLVEGTIQITKESPTPGVCPTLALVLPISSFAEAAMFGGESFPATAQALRPTRVIHFPKQRFLSELREDPALALALLHGQAVWLRRLTQQVERISGQDSQERLMLWLQEHLPVQGAFQLPMTKKALAAELGMTPETLSRGLRELQDQGWIEVKGSLLRRMAPIPSPWK